MIEEFFYSVAEGDVVNLFRCWYILGVVAPEHAYVVHKVMCVSFVYLLEVCALILIQHLLR